MSATNWFGIVTLLLVLGAIVGAFVNIEITAAMGLGATCSGMALLLVDY